MLHSEGPFEVASFEHFSLEQPFSMAAMIVFSQKCLPEVDLSCLEHIENYLQNRCVQQRSFIQGKKQEDCESKGWQTLHDF